MTTTATRTTLAAACAATGMGYYPHDLAQTALELATVAGYGLRQPGGHNQDDGNYAAVVYYQPQAAGGQQVPYLLVFNMTGPQGSLGPVQINDMLATGYPVPTLEQLAAGGLWPAAVSA